MFYSTESCDYGSVEAEEHNYDLNSEDERNFAEEQLYYQVHFESSKQDEKDEYSILNVNEDDDIVTSTPYPIKTVAKTTSLKKKRHRKAKSKDLSETMSPNHATTQKEKTSKATSVEIVSSNKSPSNLSQELLNTQEKKSKTKQKCLEEILESINMRSDIDELSHILDSCTDDDEDDDNDDDDVDTNNSERDSLLIDDDDNDDNCFNILTNIDENFSDAKEADKLFNEILSSIPIASNWSVCDADKHPIGGNKETSRYYSECKLACKNCDEKGHLAARCPYPTKRVPCILCGDDRHRFQRCPEQLCFKCDQPGHTAQGCSEGWPKFRCPRCDKKGHHAKLCPDQWRQYHFTTQSNQIVRANTLPNKRIFCFNCASEGHFGHKCVEQHLNQFYQPVSSFIYEYDNYRDKPGHTPSRKKQEIPKKVKSPKSSKNKVSKNSLAFDARDLIEIRSTNRQLESNLSKPLNRKVFVDNVACNSNGLKKNTNNHLNVKRESYSDGLDVRKNLKKSFIKKEKAHREWGDDYDRNNESDFNRNNSLSSGAFFDGRGPVLSKKKRHNNEYQYEHGFVNRFIDYSTFEDSNKVRKKSKGNRANSFNDANAFIYSNSVREDRDAQRGNHLYNHIKSNHFNKSSAGPYVRKGLQIENNDFDDFKITRNYKENTRNSNFIR